MRGKVELVEQENSGVRITPACAGKRFGFALGDPQAGDHPRVCGEKSRYFITRNSS